jgi:hypothetical protein
MPVIKPRTRGKQFVRHMTRLDRENNETLYAYAEFIGEPAEYVLNQLVETFLGKDKEFLAWRAEHPDSYVPLPVRQRRQQKRTANAERARSTAVRPAVGSAG